MSALDKIRNIGIMAHIDAGKTTTTERILYYTGKSYKIGEVDDGEATMDWMPQEQERGITITSAATTCFYRDYQINIIDTPGHVDFTAEVERALRVLDSAIGIFCAVGGVEPQSETVWRQSEHYHVPRIVYVNKMDRTGADFYNVLEELKEKLHAVPLVLQLPIGKESEFEGVIDLLHMREIRWNSSKQGSEMSYSEIDASRMDLVHEYREKLMDGLSLVSEELTDLYLEGGEVPLEMITKAIRQGTIDRAFVPVLCGASLRNVGVQPLLDAVVDYFPAPTETPPMKGEHIKTEKEVIVPCDPEGQPLGLVFKIQADRESGSINFIRMYSGVIKKGEAVYNINKNKRERINRLFRMHSNRFEQVDKVIAGDIAAVVGFKLAQTGDTIGSDKFPVLLESMNFPVPVISVAVEPKTLSERKKLEDTLRILEREDPTFTIKENEETGQLLISGMGELHLEVLVTRMIDEFNVDVRVGKPQVSYRESIQKKTKVTEKYSKTLAGKEHSASVTIQVEPADRGEGNSFSSILSAGTLPHECLEAVKRGVEGAFNSGIMFGYPCIDIKATLVGADYDPLSGSELAYETAAAIGFDAACREASPVLLEPIMIVDIMTPNEFMGETIGNLNSRGGTIVSHDSRVNIEHIRAEVPLVNMFGYSTVLRSITQGRASFSMEFSHFSPKKN
ncbi:MAG: elongation factor G [Spirochaetales bacterium]|nr:elongation factor G [Spirochaetales bacterium]